MGINDKSFIEVQFPVSKVSKESYKERKANSGQTLTGLGKWWGRKPLLLVRATILGLLMPVSDDPRKDREIFLKILSMDEEGLVYRKYLPIPVKDIYNNLLPSERKRYFTEINDRLTYISDITKEEKEKLQEIIFKRMTYDEKLKYCLRPEEYLNTNSSTWNAVNEHLGTNACDFQSLMKELGERKFGHVATVGDCFCGGGSIPFEAARVGCNVYASDLNPLAGLLTWADLNILSKSDDQIKEYRINQEKVYDEVVKRIDQLGIEMNDKGWRAKYYLYCTEVTCPECGTKVPLSPSWEISKRNSVFAKLIYNPHDNNFNFEIVTNALKHDIEVSNKCITVIDNDMYCPKCKKTTPIASIRKDKRNEDGSIQYGLRKWEKDEYIPSENDIFGERLYCIKYIDKFKNKTWHQLMKKPAPATDASYGNVYYCAPTKEDMKREVNIINYLKGRFLQWQDKGYIPAQLIEPGDKTEEPIRNRGWVYWHHLFNPRQLLILGIFMETIDSLKITREQKVLLLLGFNKCIDRLTKLARWDSVCEKAADTFYNQALNTLYNYSCRTLSTLYSIWIFDLNNYPFNGNSITELTDARRIQHTSDIWITDPPYADAINYHELSEFFLTWDKKLITELFPNWYTDSKRALAVKGTGQDFNQSMIEIYKNLAAHMNDDGMQVVMFTHQNVSVWAELTMILWSAGLRVSAAWNIATETESGGLKDGNYVKGTVILVLRKQLSNNTAYLDELYPEIEDEVKRQIDSMRDLDDKEDPNFTDADYLLAAYAASLKILTSFKQIEDIDISYELSKTKVAGEVSPIEYVINEAVKIAYDYLIPTGFDSYTWKMLIPEERFYIKGLDLEKADIYQVSAYQELARGFGVKEYKDLLGNTKANQARLKTASEFGLKGMSDNDRFGSSFLRNILAALHQSIREEDTIAGRNWLKNEVPNYWMQRNTIVEILDYISTLGHIENMPHWEQEANYANMLKERIKDDSI